MPAGDPVVAKVRIPAADGRMAVTGRELHDGVDAWAISFKPDSLTPPGPSGPSGSSVADGKPLELRDPGETGGQVIRWPVYEALAAGPAAPLATLEGAHPGALVVHDPAQLAAADQRLLPAKP